MKSFHSHGQMYANTTKVQRDPISQDGILSREMNNKRNSNRMHSVEKSHEPRFMLDEKDLCIQPIAMNQIC